MSLLKRSMVIAVVFSLGVIAGGSGVAFADDDALTNQVFFRGGFASLKNARGGEVFTDAGGATTLNGGKHGFAVGAGLDIALMKLNAESDFATTLLGEIFAEYSRFSRNTVTQPTSVLLGGTATSNIAVSELNVVVAPKARFDSLGMVRPFVIPVGLAFLVNSPPSNDTTYLDVGLHFGVGADIQFMDQLSLGVDFRYTHGFENSGTETSYYSVGSYAGINF